VETEKWIHSDAAQLSLAAERVFLEKICPGHASAQGCEVCPEGTGFTAGTWELRAILLGHFLSPSSTDALVSGFECEDHADGVGGSFLLTREGSSWRRVRYVAGMIAYDCKKLAGSDGRDRLVCGSADGWQGHFFSGLYLLDPGRVAGSADSLDPYQADRGVGFFNLEDTIGACETLVQSGAIERVELVNLAARHHVRIVVFARLGRATVPPAVVERSCSGGARVKVATVPRRYEFVFDGEKVSPGRNYRPADTPRTSYSLVK
jgi:hypothetical protein